MVRVKVSHLLLNPQGCGLLAVEEPEQHLDVVDIELVIVVYVYRAEHGHRSDDGFVLLLRDDLSAPVVEQLVKPVPYRLAELAHLRVHFVLQQHHLYVLVAAVLNSHRFEQTQPLILYFIVPLLRPLESLYAGMFQEKLLQRL